MGIQQHDAIICTGWNPEHLRAAHDFAKAIFTGFNAPTEITPKTTNSYSSFMIPPDGSKENWTESEDGNKRRQEFIAYLTKGTYDDGSTSIDFVEASFGELGFKVTNPVPGKGGA